MWSHLHTGLDNINGRVPKHTSSSSCGPTQSSLEHTDVLVVVVALDPVFEVLVDEEPNHLIGTLFQYGGRETLVGASDTCGRDQ